MDGAILPLTFYCRNAQLCLAKATESQKSGFVAEELQHLKTFTTLVSQTIPSHPNFRNRQEDKQVLELHAYLSEVTKRIRELETSVSRLQTTGIRPQTKTQGRPSSRHPKPPLGATSVASRSSLAKTRGAGEDHRDHGSVDQERSSNNVGANNQDEEERSWNETSEENSRGFRAGYGDESSADSTLKHSHHRRKKPHEDQQQRRGTRGNGLREWKGEFVRKAERIHGEGRRHNNVPQGRVDNNRPASAPRRMQQGGVLVERKSKESGENVDEVEVSADSESRVNHEKPAIMASRLQRGMKEECEHFRRDMRILLEKAHDSRHREAEVEDMLRSRLVNEMDLAAGDTNLLKHDTNNRASVGTITKSPRMNRLRGGHPPGTENSDQMQEENNKPGGTNSTRKTPSASRDTASGSSSGSSMTSLPLSHYIQKLKKFSPDSQLGSANLEFLTPVNKGSGNGSTQHSEHHDMYNSEETGALPSANEMGHGLGQGLGLLATTLSGGSAASAIFLPASTNSSNSPHGGLPRPSPRLVDNRFGASAHSVLYTSLAHPAPLLGVSRLRPSQQETSSSLAMFNSNPEQHDEDRPFSMVTPLNDQLLYPHFQNDTEVHYISAVIISM